MNEKLRKYFEFIFIYIYIMTFVMMIIGFYSVIPFFIIIIIIVIPIIFIFIVSNMDEIRYFVRLITGKDRKRLRPKKIFKINDIIELKLINGNTCIYIKGEEFIQCKFLLLNIPIEEVEDYDDVESIDDVAEKLDHSLEMGLHYSDIKKIDPETEFWGHCSNIQAFFENGLDTRLLHSNIAFPLLKELVRVKYKPAYFKFGEEIVKRFNEGNDTVREFLLIEGYIGQLEKEECECLDTIAYDKLSTKFNGLEIWRQT